MQPTVLRAGRWRRPGLGGALAGALMAVLVLAGLPRAAAGQAGTVTGIVVAEQSLRPLENVVVEVVGSSQSAVTDANGRFRLTGLTGAEVQLRASRLGYRATTAAAAVGAANVRIALPETAVALDEIVVTGTVGVQTRRELGNSVARVNAAEVAARAPVRSVQDLINGRAAGVVVLPGTGMVGSGSNIRIRGVSTFSLSNNPLIYVDGVRVNHEANTGQGVQGFGSSVVSRLNDFDPDQIESIEILRGPAAATLYGTEASRGVINIITKRGATDGTRFSMTIRQGANWFANAEGRMPVNYWRDGAGQVHELNIVQRRNQEGRPIFRTGHLQTYSGNVSGGAGGIRFFVAGELSENQGAEPNNFREQASGRVNVDATPHANVDLSASAGYVTNSTGLSCEGGCGGALFGAVFSAPWLLPENYCTLAPGYGCDFRQGFRGMPPEAYRELELSQGIDRFTGSVSMTYRPFSWLTNRLTFGMDVTHEQNEEYLPYQTIDTLAFFWGPTTGLGLKFQARRAQRFHTYDFNSSANFDLTNALSSSTSIGVQYYTRLIEFIGVQGNQFAGPGLSTVGAAAIKPYADDDYLQNNTLGLFAQETLGWMGRLFLTGALRVDNNSAFGSDVDFVAYPKASLSWVISEEPFFERAAPSFLNMFRARVAYGHSGQQPAAFAALRTFSPITGPGSTPAVTPLFVGNPDLRPERGEEIEAGFDASMLNERVSMELTYYRKRTRDAILVRATPPSSGFEGNQFVNAGALLNTGVETLLNARLLSRPSFGWDVSLNFATNKGRVERLLGQDTTIVVGSLQHRIGHDPASWFRERVVSAVYDPATNAVRDVMCDNGQGGSTPCYNDAGQLIAPRVYLGRTVPRHEGAITSNFSFMRQFVLTGMIDFKADYKKFNNNNQARCVEFQSCLENIYPERYDPTLIAQIRSGGRLQNSFFEDATFARLREVSLTWSVPQRLSRGFLGARDTHITVAGRNLHTWTSYSGLDPEANYLGAAFTEQSMMPQLMQFVASINVSF